MAGGWVSRQVSGPQSASWNDGGGCCRGCWGEPLVAQGAPATSPVQEGGRWGPWRPALLTEEAGGRAAGAVCLSPALHPRGSGRGLTLPAPQPLPRQSPSARPVVNVRMSHGSPPRACGGGRVSLAQDKSRVDGVSHQRAAPRQPAPCPRPEAEGPAHCPPAADPSPLHNTSPFL